MKKYIAFILFGILVFGCSHDDNSASLKLIGNWNWVKSSGGFAYHTETPESTGKTMKLEITNSTIKKFVNGTLDYELNYSIDSINDDGQELHIIKFEEQLMPLQIIELTQSTLKLREYNVSDGFDFTYIRD